MTDTYGPENIKAIREQLGLSRQNLLDALAEQYDYKLGQTSLRRIEQHEQVLKANEAVMFAGIFGLTTDELLMHPASTSGARVNALISEMNAEKKSLVKACARFLDSRHRLETEASGHVSDAPILTKKIHSALAADDATADAASIIASQEQEK